MKFGIAYIAYMKNLTLIVKKILQAKPVALLLDICFAVPVFFAALLMKAVRKIGFVFLPVTQKVLLRTGIMPVRNHYYEPMFDKSQLRKPLSNDRELPGIDFNTEGQLELLQSFRYSAEFSSIPDTGNNPLQFAFKNGSYEAGDAEYWYSIIRKFQPKRIIEIGSGHSTKIACLAVAKNKEENPDYTCEHICIEPYECDWLEQLNIKVIREVVENTDAALFGTLERNDILFIDSSHMIRPQGDVLFEYLEILPRLKKGVIVHIHDIFTPKDYPEDWLFKEVRFWNEQYLLEAFLTENRNWEILGAVNWLRNKHYGLLKEKCPRLTEMNSPGSFYMRKVH